MCAGDDGGQLCRNFSNFWRYLFCHQLLQRLEGLVQQGPTFVSFCTFWKSSIKHWEPVCTSLPKEVWFATPRMFHLPPRLSPTQSRPASLHSLKWGMNRRTRPPYCFPFSESSLFKLRPIVRQMPDRAVPVVGDQRGNYQAPLDGAFQPQIGEGCVKSSNGWRAEAIGLYVQLTSLASLDSSSICW